MNRSAGPSGFLESRTNTRSASLATAMHPLVPLRELLCHVDGIPNFPTGPPLRIVTTLTSVVVCNMPLITVNTRVFVLIVYEVDHLGGQTRRGTRNAKVRKRPKLFHCCGDRIAFRMSEA